MPSTETKNAHDTAIADMETLIERAETLMTILNPKNLKKRFDLLQDRLALSKDVVAHLVAHVDARERKLNKEANSLAEKQSKTEKEIAVLEAKDDKSLDECLRLAALREFLKQTNQQEARFLEAISKSDTEIRECLKRLAIPALALAHRDTAGALLDEIVRVIRPYCSGSDNGLHPNDPVSEAKKFTAYRSMDLKFRSRDLVANPSLLPEAMAQAVVVLLTEQIATLEKVTGPSLLND